MIESETLSWMFFAGILFLAIMGIVSALLVNVKRSPEFNRRAQKIFKVCLWMLFLFFYLWELSMATRESIWVIGILGGIAFVILLVGFILALAIKKNEKLQAFLQEKLKPKQQPKL